MPTTKITDATVEPVSLAEVKLNLRYENDERDSLLTSYISTARQELEGVLLRTLITTTWECALDAFPPACEPAIQLHWPRILAITSVKYLDIDGVEQTLDPQDYKLDADSEPGWLVPAYGKAWPGTRDEINAVRVRYTAGFGATAATVPAPLKTWILLRVGQHDKGCADEHLESMSRSLLLSHYKIYAV